MVSSDVAPCSGTTAIWRRKASWRLLAPARIYAPPVAQWLQPTNWKKNLQQSKDWSGKGRMSENTSISLSNHIFFDNRSIFLYLYLMFHTYCSISHASHACQAPLAGWIPNLEEDMLSLPFTSKRLAFLRVVCLFPPLLRLPGFERILNELVIQ